MIKKENRSPEDASPLVGRGAKPHLSGDIRLKKTQSLLDDFVWADLEEAERKFAFSSEAWAARAGFGADGGGRAEIGAAEGGICGGVDGDGWGVEGAGEVEGAGVA